MSGLDGGRYGGTAICFVLAAPRGESRAEGLVRAGRFWASRLRVARRIVSASWSPARRMGYAAGLRACVQSIRRLHRQVPPIFVLRPNGQEVTIADVDGVLPFAAAPYDRIPRVSEYFGREVFYKLEVFRSRGFQRVVYLDCDTLAVGDISALWDLNQYRDHQLYGVLEQADLGVAPELYGVMNTGVLVINEPLLDDRVYERLFALALSGRSYDRGDQGVIDAFLRESDAALAGELDPVYNVFVRAKKEGRWEAFADRLKILHFVNGLKPWSTEHHHDWLYDEEFKRWWDEAYRMGPMEPHSHAGA